MIATDANDEYDDVRGQDLLIPVITFFFKIMSGDPFERFERSRSGLLIPVLIFIVGAMLTTLALRSLNDLASMENLAEEPPAAIEPVAIEPAIGPEHDGAAEPAVESEVENVIDNQEPSSK